MKGAALCYLMFLFMDLLFVYSVVTTSSLPSFS